MKLSQISSHYAGMLKAHATSQEQGFAWEAMMTMANKIENLEKRLAELEEAHKKVSLVAEHALRATARIGNP